MLPFVSGDLPLGLALRLSSWLMPWVLRDRALDDILKRSAAKRGDLPYRGRLASDILADVRRVAAHPWFMRDRRCLREGLLAFHFLALAGYRPILRFGLQRGSLGQNKPAAHCWIILDGAVVLNPPDDSMVPLFDWDGECQIPASPGAGGPVSG